MRKRLRECSPLTEEQRALVDNNHNLIYSFLRCHNLSIDDYYGLAAIGLCKAAANFDANKSRFSTHAYRCMFSTVFKEIREQKAQKRIPEDKILYYQIEFNDSKDGDTSTFLNCLPSKENIENDVLAKIILAKYMSALDDRDKCILSLFSEGYKQTEIGEIIGCSQVRISRIKKKLRKRLYDIAGL